MKNVRVSFITALLIAAASLFGAPGARATVVDLINGDSGVLNGGAIADWTDFKATGSGDVQSFLRVQADGTEQGYNTSGSPLPFDDKAGAFTHDITFADLLTTEVTLGGQNYFKLLLDVAQLSNSPLISLDDLRIYTSATGSLTTTNLSLLGTLRYSFTGNDKILLDASRNSGNGSGDMFLYIPVSAFAGTLSTDFVYLYCLFGTTYGTNGGPEEWSLIVNAVPEVSTFFPIVGLLAAVFSTQFIRRRQLQHVSK